MANNKNGPVLQSQEEFNKNEAVVSAENTIGTLRDRTKVLKINKFTLGPEAKSFVLGLCTYSALLDVYNLKTRTVITRHVCKLCIQLSELKSRVNKNLVKVGYAKFSWKVYLKHVAQDCQAYCVGHVTDTLRDMKMKFKYD